MSVKKKSFLKASKTKKTDKVKSLQKPNHKRKFVKNNKNKRNVKSPTVKVKHASVRSGNSSGGSDVEEEFEKVPRSQTIVKVKNLLPVKNKTGIVYRSHVVEEDEEEATPEPAAKEKEQKERNLIQNYSIQQKCLADLKRKVALLCTSLIEEPDNNIVALKQLILLLQKPNTKMIVSEKKILCLSLLHVFSDILPSYRLRVPEEAGSKVLLKKETRKLLGYEQTLLKCYKKYIDLLFDLIRAMRWASPLSTPSIRQRASKEIGMIAVKCMCELLSTRFSFNYFKDIANKLVPLAIDSDEEVSKMCCQSFEKMFRTDKLGEASFGLVNQLINVIKERKFNIPIFLLRTFLSLNLKEAKVNVEKVDMGKGRKQWQKMSRTERKDKKKIKELQSELKEAQAYESIENVRKFHTKTLKKIFWVFFHILKDGRKVALIAPALEGLSKFAYLINLEFFDDLNSVLCAMMENGKLNEVQKLHGVYTLFTILAGQAESLHIDPHQIYCHMYEGLLNLGHGISVQHFDLTLKCLEFNILRKKKRISPSRILAFTKRICTVSLQTPIHGTLGLLQSVRKILLNVKGTDILLDTESSLGSGVYLPELNDPEHCNPQSTALWELHVLRQHYNPAVKLFAQHLLNGCPNHGRLSLPDKLSRSSPEEILKLYSDVAVNNKMDFMEDVEEPPKKKIKFDRHSFSLPSEENVHLELDWDDLQKVQFVVPN